MFATFHIYGRSPVSYDFWNIIAKGFAIILLNSFSTLGCRLSGPGNLVQFRLSSFFLTISAVNSISPSTSLSACSSTAGMACRFSLVKTLANASLSALAFSKSVFARLTSSLSRSAIPTLVFNFELT